jgi:hypothetical protein
MNLPDFSRRDLQGFRKCYIVSTELPLFCRTLYSNSVVLDASPCENMEAGLEWENLTPVFVSRESVLPLKDTVPPFGPQMNAKHRHHRFEAIHKQL